MIKMSPQILSISLPICRGQYRNSESIESNPDEYKKMIQQERMEMAKQTNKSLMSDWMISFQRLTVSEVACKKRDPDKIRLAGLTHLHSLLKRNTLAFFAAKMKPINVFSQHHGR